MKQGLFRKDNKKKLSYKVTKASVGIYYVQVRAYKTDSTGAKVYGAWSNAKNAKYVLFNTSISNGQIEKILKNTKNAKNRKAAQYVLARIGHPYSQGRRNDGYHYDCSSLAYHAWKFAGVNIASGKNFYTASSEHAKLRGKRVSWKNASAGSLVFYRFGGRVSHVGIYIGNGKMVDAAGPGKGVKYRYLFQRGNICAVANPAK